MKMLWKLATPNMVAVFFITFSTMADAFFVGKIGTVALASLAIVFPLQTLMIMQAGGAMGGGITSSISRSLGRNALDNVNTLVWHSIVISGSMCAIYTLLFGLLSHYILSLIHI